VHFTSSDGAAVLPANSTLTNGVGTFSVTLKTAGSQTLTATDTVTGSITGTSGGTTVSAAAATGLTVTAPGTATAGVAFNVTVTAKDPFGNTTTGYVGTVQFTSTDGAAALPANSTLTNGVGTFSVTLNTAGSKSITATDTVTSSITGTSSGVTVSLPLPTVTAVSPNAGPTTGGTSVTITGTNLTGATAVKFGSTNATNVVVVSATSITATSPAGSAGAVDVTVTTLGGTSATSGADQFTYAVRQTTPTATAAGTGTVSAQIVNGSASCSIDTANSTPYLPPSYNGITPPLGGMKVRITGCGNGDTVTVAVTFSNLNGMTGMKYGKTPTSGGASVWYTPNGLSVSGNTITYTVTDNGLGDDTFSGVDGIINDPIVPVPVPVEPAGIPTLNEWGLLALSGLVAVFAAGTIRRRRVEH